MTFEIPNKLHIELTTRCRLQCPKCPRTIYAGQFKPNQDISIEVLERLFSNNRYEIIDLCGNLGDPIYHPQFLEILELCTKYADSVVFNTNGTGKEVEWWKKVYEVLRPTDYVYFGIDGLPGTSELYRINQVWEDSFGAMKLGASLHKNVIWHWIAFRFNENEIQEARALASRHGIRFYLLKSARWDKDDPLQPNDETLYVKILDI